MQASVTEPPFAPGEERRIRRFYLQMGAALAGYVVLRIVSAKLLEAGLGLPGAGEVALALLPVLGLLAVAWVFLRRLRAMDELERHDFVRAFAVAGAATMLLALGYGALEEIGWPRLSMTDVGTGMLLGTAAVRLVLRRGSFVRPSVNPSPAEDRP